MITARDLNPSFPFAMTRATFLKTLLSGVAGAAALGGYGRWIEPSILSVSRHTIGGATASPALRLVQISDLHLKAVGKHEEKVAERLHELAPDVLLFTGDAIDAPDNLHLLGTFLSLLPRTRHALAVLGNWEHWAQIDRKQLEGVYGRHGTRRDHIASRVLFGDYQPQAVLSGHTHGGQVQVLGWAPVRPPGSGRYVSGWYKESEPHLFVSRGIGTSVFPVRLGASPELPLFEWYLH
ncbi:MAG: hypothetical protein GVY15_11225 [Bacteroidetes bacterium]|jgi:predicted MPP superfamily phosphohydrolase|nr:hypothetical protein [Bacteroidota bacterium]